jgi:hypothetical protein
MTIELDNDMRRAVGLAVQILEDVPEWLRPESNMSDMRDLLAGETTGRDGPILVEAVAVALAHRTIEIVSGSKSPAAFSNRIDEFTALFRLVRRADARLFAVRYVEMCDRLARREDA